MERQLKERLIGAAVLIAIAVILVPEMFSGTSSRPHETTAHDGIDAGQLKTYQIDLQASSVMATAPAEAVQPVVDSPALVPQDELPGEAAETEGAAVARPPVSSLSIASTSSSKSAASSVASESHPVIRQKSSKAVDVRPVVAEKPKLESAPTKLNSDVRSGRWAVQIGSFGAQDKAQQIAGKIKSQGFTAAVTPIKAGGKTLYRVRTGGLAERAAADAALKKLKATYPDASVVPIS